MGASGSDEGMLHLEQRISKPWAWEGNGHTNTALQLPVTQGLTKCATNQVTH